MKVFFSIVGLVHAVKINDYDQGAMFDKCISVSDFQTKTIDDDITLTDRDANGCCAAGSVPGLFRFPEYQGPQVVCGSTGDKSYAAAASGACAYGTCYVYKQNLPCADGTKQHLNGCCAAHTGTFSGFEDTCEGYEKTVKNTHNEDVEYCTTYHKSYGKIGRMGTTEAKDDFKNALQWLGGSPSTPLMVCQGDCDADGDCPAGSTCIDRTGHSPDVDGCAVGDSKDSSRADTDYCSNPGSTTAPTMEISCLNEYSACCGHVTRNGGCASSADYMSATNSKLSENACAAPVQTPTPTPSPSPSPTPTATSNSSNATPDTDGAVEASAGCVLLLAASSIAI